ncbi:hypothetical protein GYMLUDRAFT_705894 [Collybiopsis luxurians FD-317 M1]|uniref:Uncharacterized protein n=1 Tax=Collybiopsis luxurians FD-317 M1 TaxID=944289 RepID=A0A0D0CRA3_9AGAR|nr:hypothetical protein GYMLUDRAFT_705894 [Collybiopsis luxurians FD-317 M1]
MPWLWLIRRRRLRMSVDGPVTRYCIRGCDPGYKNAHSSAEFSNLEMTRVFGCALLVTRYSNHDKPFLFFFEEALTNEQNASIVIYTRIPLLKHSICQSVYGRDATVDIVGVLILWRPQTTECTREPGHCRRSMQSGSLMPRLCLVSPFIYFCHWSGSKTVYSLPIPG